MIEYDFWDSNFHSISLYNTLEYLSSNSKNIKELLQHMTKYIKNKSINYSKTNDIPDLSSVGEVAWNFISIIYESGWDSLIANKENRTFRQCVTQKFTPKLQETRTPTNKDKLTDKPASFMKLPPLIPAKTSKKVIEIFKFFKKSTKLRKHFQNYQ